MCNSCCPNVSPISAWSTEDGERAPSPLGGFQFAREIPRSALVNLDIDAPPAPGLISRQRPRLISSQEEIVWPCTLRMQNFPPLLCFSSMETLPTANTSPSN